MIINLITQFLFPTHPSVARQRQEGKKQTTCVRVAEGHMTGRMPTRLPVGSNSDESETGENTL